MQIKRITYFIIPFLVCALVFSFALACGDSSNDVPKKVEDEEKKEEVAETEEAEGQKSEEDGDVEGKKEEIPTIEASDWIRFSGPVSNENKKNFEEFLKDNKIEVNSGIIKVHIEAGDVFIDTSEDNFGQIKTEGMMTKEDY